ncbi:MAG: hypothetical protein IT581_18305 [Verrucomicrobiales bacterium]|nr:hypothetical protein [Verrucomicrobiales bacterium]
MVFSTLFSPTPADKAPASSRVMLVAALVLFFSNGLAGAATLPPGASVCVSNALPANYGSFVLTKSTLFQQSPTGTPVEAASGAAALIELQSPTAYAISNALVSGPGNFRANLTTTAPGVSGWSSNYATEAALNNTLLAGPWTTSFQLSFTNGDAGVGFFPLILASNLPPLPSLANLSAAQNINPAAAFNLAWTSWADASTNDRISLQIVDSSGAAVASAASDCTGAIPISPIASSVDFPAGTFAAGRSYTGYLTFGASLFEATDASALLVERVFQSRTTQFTLRTTGSSGGGEFGTIEQPVISGTNLVFTLKGTPGSSYAIESTTDWTAWTQETEVTLPASGSLEVRLPLSANGTPKFYRARSLGGEVEPGGAATLSLTNVGPGLLSLTVFGTPGASYTVESTDTYQTWTAVTNVTLPSGSSNQVVQIAIGPATAFLAFRATTSGTVTPPTGKSPVLNLAATQPNEFQLKVTGADANATYSVQFVAVGDGSGPDWAAGWTSLSTTVTTAADGTGRATLSGAANGSARAAFYRLLKR